MSKACKATIFVDSVTQYASGKWCRCWTDGTDKDLDQFARKIGLTKKDARCLVGITGQHYHYELVPEKRELALKNGAKVLSLEQFWREKMRIDALAKLAKTRCRCVIVPVVAKAFSENGELS